MKGQRLPGVREEEHEVITWRCSKGCALLRVYVSKAWGWHLVTWWHAPQRPPSGLAARRGNTTATRSPNAGEFFPLDRPWPAVVDLELACKHGHRGAVDLDMLAADVAALRAAHKPVSRTLEK